MTRAAIKYDCKCQTESRNWYGTPDKGPDWRHSEDCEEWKRLEQSVVAFIFLSPYEDDWDKRCQAWHVPRRYRLPCPPDTNDCLKQKTFQIGERHPTYKALVWFYGLHPDSKQYTLYWTMRLLA